MADYGAGQPLNELMQRFRQHRNALSNALEGQGAPRHYRTMEGRRLIEAISAYQSGKSLATAGNQLGVCLDHVRLALTRAGVELRPRPG